jgi:hypothetical protein
MTEILSSNSQHLLSYFSSVSLFDESAGRMCQRALVGESGVNPCRYHSTIALHAHISPGGWIVGQLVVVVHRRSLTPSTWTTTTITIATSSLKWHKRKNRALLNAVVLTKMCPNWMMFMSCEWVLQAATETIQVPKFAVCMLPALLSAKVRETFGVQRYQYPYHCVVACGRGKD